MTVFVFTFVLVFVFVLVTDFWLVRLILGVIDDAFPILDLSLFARGNTEYR